MEIIKKPYILKIVNGYKIMSCGYIHPDDDSLMCDAVHGGRYFVPDKNKNLTIVTQEWIINWFNPETMKSGAFTNV